jgi:hypothetical protein
MRKISPAVRSLGPAVRPGPGKECESKCATEAEAPRDVVGHLRDTNVRQMQQRMRYTQINKISPEVRSLEPAVWPGSGKN